MYIYIMQLWKRLSFKTILWKSNCLKYSKTCFFCYSNTNQTLLWCYSDRGDDFSMCHFKDFSFGWKTYLFDIGSPKMVLICFFYGPKTVPNGLPPSPSLASAMVPCQGAKQLRKNIFLMTFHHFHLNKKCPLLGGLNICVFNC